MTAFRTFHFNTPFLLLSGLNNAFNNYTLVKIVDSGDEADVASDAVDRTLLDSLSAQDAQRLRLIDNALDRIRQGKYGLCAKCGKEIPQARLEALPYALMCVACASAEERRRR